MLYFLVLVLVVCLALAVLRLLPLVFFTWAFSGYGIRTRGFSSPLFWLA
jgi:hypothetical protein